MVEERAQLNSAEHDCKDVSLIKGKETKDSLKSGENDRAPPIEDSD